MSEFTIVSREIFLVWLSKYRETAIARGVAPSDLKGDICGIYEPPLESYNDFSLGDWPDSVVAWFAKCDDEASRVYQVRTDLLPLD
jgi:hypothetical protein